MLDRALEHFMPDQRNISLFIVEDNEVGRTGFELIFSKEPSIDIVGTAANADDALARIPQLKPDVILIKRDLPGFDGLKLAKALNAEYPEGKMLLFATKVSGADLASFIACGGMGYCLSSISFTNLRLAIQSAAAGALWLEPASANTVRDMMSVQIAHTDSDLSRVTRATPLTERESDVLRLVVDGLTNQQIAERLCVSTETVKTHIRRIMDKSAIRRRRELIAKAITDQLV